MRLDGPEGRLVKVRPANVEEEEDDWTGGVGGGWWRWREEEDMYKYSTNRTPYLLSPRL